MAEVQWIKLYVDIFSDNTKIKKIRRLPAGNEILLFWIMLLTMAGKCNAGGMIFITERVPFSPEDLADECRLDVSTITFGLETFVRFGMIELSDEGFITIINWDEYQNADKLAEIRAKDRERKRLKREETKALLENSANVRGHSADSPHIEEEKEEGKEKEFHSFNHSLAREENIYIEEKVRESGLRGEDAEVYREEIKDGLRLKYMQGTLGQGVVFMSDKQFGDLCDKLSIAELDKYMGIIVECERSGKKYKKSHYQAILDMASKDRRLNK